MVSLRSLCGDCVRILEAHLAIPSRVRTMKKEYDLSTMKSRPNPYAEAKETEEGQQNVANGSDFDERAWGRQSIGDSILVSRIKKVTIEEIEPLCGKMDGWASLKEKALKGGELWYFKTPIETWTTMFPLCGFEGYVLVENDEIVDKLLIAMS